jgi:hypothetical protein
MLVGGMAFSWLLHLRPWPALEIWTITIVLLVLTRLDVRANVLMKLAVHDCGLW